MSTLVFQFPGQSSRYPGMIDKISALGSPARRVLDQASECLGWDVARHFREDTAYGRNRDIQVGVFLANHMFLTLLHEAGITADVSLGLSLGEYNHLVHIEALSFESALRVVEARGEAYDAGPRGSMAAVFPIALEELEAVAARAREHGVIEVVNRNSPTQQVLAGETAAVDAALRLVEEETYATAVITERQVPMHSSLFEVVGSKLRAVLQQASFRVPNRPYLPNRLGRVLEDPRLDDFVNLLSSHVHSPVLWRDSIDHVVTRWPEAIFVEVGPMSVLSNLLDRKWHDNVKMHMDAREDGASQLAAVIDQLRPLASPEGVS